MILIWKTNKIFGAFTLAELLIVIGLIGVVAESTIPTMVNDFQEKLLVTQLKNSVSIINQAYLNVVNDNGDPTYWKVSQMDDVANYFAPYLMTSKTCIYGTLCSSKMGYTSAPKDLRKNNINNLPAQIMLKSGEVLSFSHQVSVASGLNCGAMGCFILEVDVNGIKKPNRYGVDIFTFQVDRAVIKPRGAPGTWGTGALYCNPTADTGSAGWWNGTACANWVLKKENLDYLKCIDKGDSAYCVTTY